MWQSTGILFFLLAIAINSHHGSVQAFSTASSPSNNNAPQPSISQQRPRRVTKIVKKKPIKTNGIAPAGTLDAATNKAEQVERQLLLALEALQETIRIAALDDSTKTKTTTSSGLLFPSIRECNAALATFGDNDELLRALRLFMKMRKANLLCQHQMVPRMGWSWPVPSPTLVTYSTIMSRANRGGKPRVALRMWKLMQNAPEFTTTKDVSSSSSPTDNNNNTPLMIVPDIKAANILMNSYAKLADIDSARDVLQQMKHGHGKDVPRLQPNLITYNTLLDACHKAGDLDAALDVMTELEEPFQLGDDDPAGISDNNNNSHPPHLTPDAWSYTSLIATVARKPSKASGVHDPSLAFEFLEEMKARNIRPNGMTYSALIDVCGRCKRADMALQGLRIMLRQKAEDQEYLKTQRKKAKQQNNNKKQKKSPNKNNSRGLNYKGKPENYSLPNEVGAWTAAINALGKEGRLRAAMRLFNSMPQFGVQPNAVTCGCLTDSLVKHGCMADALHVLRYMEDAGITPSEVMYTSLMSSAGDLAQLESKNEFSPMLNLDGDIADSGKQISTNEQYIQEMTQKENPSKAAGAPVCSAIEVYTVLMKSLMEDRERNVRNNNNGNKNAQGKTAQEIQEANAHSLMKVFLVFQEMKESGAQPDLACYNALLRACARVGDIDRAQSVLKQLQEDSLEPNDTSWRQLIRAAGKAKRVDIVISTWKMAMDYSYDIRSHLGFNSQLRRTQWIPSSETVATMISTLLRRAGDPTLEESEKKRVYHKIVVMYLRIISGNKDEQLGMHRVDSAELVKDTRAMLLILQAIVSLERLTPTDGSFPNAANEKSKLHFLAARILDLEALQEIYETQRLSRSNLRSLSITQSWIDKGYISEALRP